MCCKIRLDFLTLANNWDCGCTCQMKGNEKFSSSLKSQNIKLHHTAHLYPVVDDVFLYQILPDFLLDNSICRETKHLIKSGSQAPLDIAYNI